MIGFMAIGTKQGSTIFFSGFSVRYSMDMLTVACKSSEQATQA